MLDPNSPQAQSIWNLFMWSLAIGTGIFALVTGLVLYVVWRYRHRQGQSEPRQLTGNTRLEVGWTVAPMLLLIAIFVPTLMVMRAVDPEATREPDIILTGYQWWWKVEYPQSGIETANEIHIPVGKQILVRLEANDVIHNFWVPELAPKKDMIPGHHTNTLWLAADTPGVYRGVCAEFCGVQHAKMEIYVIAHPQNEFDGWLAQQQQIDPAPTIGVAAEGAQLYHDLACVNCHATAGAHGAVGVGPNLTHLGSRLTLGAGAIPNTPENLARWIANPEEIKPGVYMPGYGRTLSREDLQALVAYLETLK